jgi:DNA-binding YbaB/EbfC family protein
MNQIMKMAQTMSQQMEEKMSALSVEGNAGGGMVKLTMNGHKMVTDIRISPEVVDPEDVEMLQDLIVAALNDAISRVDGELKGNIGGMMPGGGLPGGFPFPGF